MTDNTQDTAAPAKEKFSWNAFVPIKDAAHARTLAKDGGLACVGLIALGYVAMTVIVLLGGQSPYAPGGDAGVTLIAHGVVLAIAAALGWFIWKNQPLWAVGLAFGWMAIETAGKVMMLLSGAGGGGAASFVLNALGLVVGIQAVRGALWLSKTGGANTPS